jgi:hypothetical protein
MRKICLLSLTLASLTAILCACGNTNTATDSENKKESSQTTVSKSTSTNGKTETSTTNSETVKRTETSSDLNETENTSETNAEIAETESSSELSAEIPVTEDNKETNAEPVINHQLNLDLLSDIGLNYDEIAGKRGKRLDIFSDAGGFSYLFKNGSGTYGWPISAVYEEGNWPKDANGNFIKIEDLPKPNAEKKCGIIKNIKTENLLLGITNAMTVSEIEKIYGIKCVDTKSADGWNGWKYVSTFLYGDIEINIYTNEEGKIALDSEVDLLKKD